MTNKFLKTNFIIITLTLIFISSILSGCNFTRAEQIPESPDTSMFVIVEVCDSYKVVYDKETKVMYTISNSIRNSGEFTVLLNADGTPKLFEQN